MEVLNTLNPFARPVYVMVKPSGSRCNLACHYCYYLEKGNLYKDQRNTVISDELLRKFVKDYIACQTQREVLFTWHGGEPLMLPLSFYQKAMDLQRQYANGHVIDNCIQTNGTLLTDDYCRFFHDNGWLVGISIDGPQEFHDAYRKTRSGKPSFRQVMKGIRLLKKHEVEWNALAVVNDYNADEPQAFYQFFKDIGCQYLQFAPVVERLMPHTDGRHLVHVKDEGEWPLADFSVTPAQWGSFLCGVFDEWVVQDVGTVFVQLFDATLANWCGEEPGVCTMSPTCGHAAVMESGGDVFSCDHFVFPEYKIGNLHDHTFLEMLYGEQQRNFAQLKQQLPRLCKECRYLFACHGECPKNRFLTTEDGEPGLNYLCKGYKQFFQHVAPYMDFMKAELDAGRAPARVMDAIRTGALPYPEKS